MKQDEIIEMARQAGFPFNKFGLLKGNDEGEIDADAMFKAFAKLVAAKERERYMQLFLDPENQPTQFGTATQEYREQEIKEEREACARLVAHPFFGAQGKECAEAIQARGEA